MIVIISLSFVSCTGEGSLVEIRRESFDAFGQSNAGLFIVFQYNDYGECFELSDLNDNFEFINVFGLKQSKIITSQYDDSGRLVYIELGQRAVLESSSDFIETQITLAYDERGNLTEAKFLRNDGTSWSNAYSYNEAGQVVTAKYSGRVNYFEGSNVLRDESLRQEKCYCEYEYDKQWRLVKEIVAGDENYDLEYASVTEYVYHENGQLKEKISSDRKAVYTYNEKGQISYIEYISLDGMRRVLYKDIYYYADMAFYSKNSRMFDRRR